MLRPKRTLLELSKLPLEDSRWLLWRRPLFVLLILCCSFSLMTSGRLSLHLVASTAIYWSFLPLVQIFGLMAAEKGHLKAGMVDRFFMGYGPTLLYVMAFAAYSSSPAGILLSPAGMDFWAVTAAGGLGWSCWIDYRFFNSLRKLAIQRVISWTLFSAIFMGSWLWNEISWRLGL